MLPEHPPGALRHPRGSLTYGTQGASAEITQEATCGGQWCGFIVCVSGPRVRQTTCSFLQFNAPPALHCLILAPYYTGGPSWLFGAAPGGKIWAIWPQHHRMPMSNLEAKKTSATWTTTKPIQLAWLPRFAPTSVSHPLGVLRGSHAKIRAGFLCYGSAPPLHLRARRCWCENKK